MVNLTEINSLKFRASVWFVSFLFSLFFVLHRRPFWFTLCACRIEFLLWPFIFIASFLVVVEVSRCSLNLPHLLTTKHRSRLISWSFWSPLWTAYITPYHLYIILMYTLLNDDIKWMHSTLCCVKPLFFLCKQFSCIFALLLFLHRLTYSVHFFVAFCWFLCNPCAVYR